MLRKLACILALLSGVWLASAQGLGLGEIDVRSTLNRPFIAVIPLLSASAEDIESLTVRAADAGSLDGAGIARSDAPPSLQFALVQGGAGHQIRVTSTQSIRDPMLNFLVEASWNGGYLQRQYNVQLDSSTASAGVPVVSIPRSSRAGSGAREPVIALSTSPRPEATTQSRRTLRRTVAVAVVEPPSAGASLLAADRAIGPYGPVRADETLWSIAKKLRPDTGVTMDQMLLALFENNPQAFESGIDGLLENSLLTVPPKARIQAVDAATARTRVAQLRGLSTTGSPQQANADAPPPVSPSQSPTPVPAEVVAPTANEQAAATVEPPATAETPSNAGTPPVETTPVETPAPRSETALPSQVSTPSAETTAPMQSPTVQELIDRYLLPLMGVLLLLILIGAVLVRRSRDAEAARTGAAAAEAGKNWGGRAAPTVGTPPDAGNPEGQPGPAEVHAAPAGSDRTISTAVETNKPVPSKPSWPPTSWPPLSSALRSPVELAPESESESGDGDYELSENQNDAKLDLARAYADMGDNDAARELLSEVIQGGDDKQKREAETLRLRLPL